MKKAARSSSACASLAAKDMRTLTDALVDLVVALSKSDPRVRAQFAAALGGAARRGDVAEGERRAVRALVEILRAEQRDS